MTVFIEITCPYCHDKSIYGIPMRDLRLSESWAGLKKECILCERVFSFDIRRYTTYEAIGVTEANDDENLQKNSNNPS